MRVSQILHAMDKDELIVINDYNEPIDKMTLYHGTVRGIKRDDPINKMHILNVCADDDTILVLVQKPEMKGGADNG
jgi:hypothetical protein